MLAIKRQTELLREKVAHIKLKFSDTLLILIPRDKIDRLKSNSDFIVMEELDLHLRYERFWWMSILVIPMVMILSALEIISITEGAVFGVITVLLVRAITIQEAYKSINWTVIFLLAALVPINKAIIKTGADQYIGQMIQSLAEYLVSFGGSEFTVYLSLLYFVTFENQN